MRRDTPHLSVFSLNTGKCGPERTLYLDTFSTVFPLKIYLGNMNKSAENGIEFICNCIHLIEILYGNIALEMFKGFLSCALHICLEKYLAQEIEFLINVFAKNGRSITDLERVTKEYTSNITSVKKKIYRQLRMIK